MNNLLTFIIGMPGKGKTTAFRDLGSETVMYNTENKMPPFQNKGIRIAIPDNVDDLITRLKKFQGNAYPEITTVILDSFTDFSDLLLAECRAKFKGFDIFSAYNSKIFELFKALQSIENRFVFVTAHPETVTDADGNIIYRIAVKGKEFEGKVERFATCCFTAETKRKAAGPGVDYIFLTNDDGRFSAKSPMGMFKELYIPNNVKDIIKVYREFYSIPEPIQVPLAISA
jgi:hypothetical protein